MTSDQSRQDVAFCDDVSGSDASGWVCVRKDTANRLSAFIWPKTSRFQRRLHLVFIEIPSTKNLTVWRRSASLRIWRSRGFQFCTVTWSHGYVMQEFSIKLANLSDRVVQLDRTTSDSPLCRRLNSRLPCISWELLGFSTQVDCQLRNSSSRPGSETVTKSNVGYGSNGQWMKRLSLCWFQPVIRGLSWNCIPRATPSDDRILASWQTCCSWWRHRYSFPVGTAHFAVANEFPPRRGGSLDTWLLRWLLPVTAIDGLRGLL